MRQAERGVPTLLAGPQRATRDVRRLINFVCKRDMTRWQVILVDEAHKARDPDSMLFRNLRELRTGGPCAPNGVVILATATMFMNRPGDVHSLLSLATDNPHLPPGLGALSVYRPRFMCAATAAGVEEVEEGLPPLVTRVVEVDMTPEEEVLYASSSRNYMDEWESGRLAAGVRNKSGMRGMLLGLRVVLEDPANVVPDIFSSKAAALRDLLTEERNERWLVYCVFRGTPRAIMAAAAAATPPRTVYVLNGGVSKPARVRVLAGWKADPRGVLAAQLHVAGLGHNWQFAARVVFMIR